MKLPAKSQYVEGSSKKKLANSENIYTIIFLKEKHQITPRCKGFESFRGTNSMSLNADKKIHTSKAKIISKTNFANNVLRNLDSIPLQTYI